MINGIINVYKEKGYTSFDVVAKMRRLTHIKKIGHTGTLDPMAEGVLPVCIGRATKVCEMITDHTKTYVAEMKLGLSTDTQDITGEILSTASVEELQAVSEDLLIETINSFVGNIEQIPPMYSAVKINGQKLCDLARRGIDVPRKPRNITVYYIKIIDIELPLVKMEIKCSKGTYIRTLCDDIGTSLGCGAVMTSLIRTEVGRFSLLNSYKMDQVREYLENGRIEDILIGVDSIFGDYPELILHEEDVRGVSHGNSIESGKYSLSGQICSGDLVRVYDYNGTFYAIYQLAEDMFKPFKMFL